ncbi:non-ribosomal peptide synthetase [Chengkuizengella marina]|nr:non-ribosomal peptide synthetase [Chengkuizengella marina]
MSIKVAYKGVVLEFDKAPTPMQIKQKYEEVTSQKSVKRWSATETSEITPVGEKEFYPLTFAQESLWLAEKMSDEDLQNCVAFAIHMKGTLDREAFQSSMQMLMKRHDILNMTININENNPSQIKHEDWHVPISYNQLNDVSEQQLHLLTQQFVGEPFSLENGPLIRIQLNECGKEEHVAFICIHHIIFDGASVPLFIKEWGKLYEQLKNKNLKGLEPLKIQYQDYATWERDNLDFAQSEKYWRNKLGNNIPILQLPTDVDRSDFSTGRGALQTVQYNEEITQQLRTLCRENGVSLFMMMLTAYKVFLHRITNQDDMIVGTPVMTRGMKGTDELLGCFINTIPLKTELWGNPAFSDVLGRVRLTVLESFQHQKYPFSKLVELLQPERNSGHHPIFQVSMGLLENPFETIELSDLHISSYEIVPESLDFDLHLDVIDQSETLVMKWQYRADLFEQHTIKNMMKWFEVLLKGIITDPSQRISDLPLLTAEEKEKILVKWNDTDKDFPQDLCVHQLVEAQAMRTPERSAVMVEGTSLSYQALNEQAESLASYLQRLGVGPDVLVGVYMERSIDLIVSLLAIWKAGGAYVPLDPSNPNQRLLYMVEDSQVKIILTQLDLQEKLAVADEIMMINVNEQGRQEIFKEEQNTSLLEREVNANHLAYVIYTSGSTGRPKGVMVEHRNLCHLIFTHQAAYDVTEKDRASHLAGLGFDASVWEVWPYLTVGALVVLADEETRLSPTKLRDWIIKHKITMCFASTPLAKSMQRLEWPAQPSLRYLLTGGEKLTSTPDSLLPFTLINHYGPTETTVVATAGEVHSDASSSIPTIGRPIANVHIYILDQHLQPVPIGVPGEICIGGLGVARGYLGKEDMTRDKFISSPFQHEGERLYRSGDIGKYNADGEIEYIGRMDDQVKVNGVRVELGEIERVLCSYDLVNDAVVVLKEKQHGGKSIAAYVVVEQQHKEVERLLEIFMKEQLPQVMVPAMYVLMDALPLNVNGKVERKALPDPEIYSSQEQKIDPNTATEEDLAMIWKSILQVESVGIYDSFFKLGGHSLLATQLLSHIRSTFGVEISLRDLFKEPTIAHVGKMIDDTKKDGLEEQLPPINSIDRTLPIPLSFAQQRLWFLDQLEPHSSLYNIRAAFRLRGLLYKDALVFSLNELVRRHETLRTTFHMIDGEPVQTIQPPSSAMIEEVDIRHQDDQMKEQMVMHTAYEEAQTPFSLTEGPLFRSKLLVLDEQEHVIYFTMHHIISDGWSISIFVKEFMERYEAYCKKTADDLPELSIQYADFANWQRKWLKGNTLEKQETYWKEQFAEEIPVLELPTDFLRAPVNKYQGAVYPFEMTKEVLRNVHHLCEQQNTTLFMTLLAAFQILLYRYSGQDDLVVGTPIANRKHQETESLIGFFVNMLPLRTDVSGNPNIEELLARVKEVTLQAYSHQDVPFEKLVELLHPERDLSRSPLFQVMFILQNAPKQELDLPDLILEPIPVDKGLTKYDLTFSVEEQEDKLIGTINYSTDLFKPSTIQKMIGHWTNILVEMARDCKQTIDELCYMTTEEQQRMVKEWSFTERKERPESCFHDLFEQHVAIRSDQPAVIHHDKVLTYKQLDSQANQLAHLLQQRGVGPEVVVGLLIDRSWQMIVSILAVHKAGGVYLPIDPSLPKDRMAFMLTDARVKLLLIQEHIAANIEMVSEAVILDKECHVYSHYSKEKPRCESKPSNAAYVLYTSGSTGQPKGAVIEHSSLVNYVLSIQERYKLESGLSYGMVIPATVDSSKTVLDVSLATGGTLHVLDYETSIDVYALSQYYDKHWIDVLKIAPSHLKALIQVSDAPSILPKKLLITGGEALDWDLVQQIFDRAPQCDVFNHYGPTETTVGVLTYKVEQIHHRDQMSTVPLGRPLSNTSIYILDKNKKPVSVGVPGEIYIGGAGVARGYINKEETNRQFVQHPLDFKSDEKLYRTGDIARYLPDGNIEFIGRTDDQVSVRGFRIECGEITRILCSYEKIQNAHVVMKENERGEQYLAAYVVAKSVSALSVQEIHSFLNRQVPQYMIPSFFEFMEELPLSANGKVNRKALPEPKQSPSLMKVKYVSPETTTEKVLASLWQELLNIDSISVHDNFFKRGGHSLLATQCIARLRKMLNKDIPLRLLFETSNLLEMAKKMDQIDKSEHKVDGMQIQRAKRSKMILREI